MARAWRATLASASCAARSSVTSTSGFTVRGVPVVANAAGTPLRSDQPPATLASASGSRAPSSSPGPIARTDRRASVRPSRARVIAASRCPLSSAPRARACAAASSWATIPVRSWAIVSWISRASRWRSCSTPASRSISSRWRPRSSEISAAANIAPAMNRLMKTTASTTGQVAHSCSGQPPTWQMPDRIAVIASGGARHHSGSSSTDR